MAELAQVLEPIVVWVIPGGTWDHSYVRQAETTVKGSYEQLTGREREVLQLIAEGHSSREIAEQLYIGENTARTHRANLVDKLDLHSTAELTQYAIRKGLVCLDS